MFFILLQTTGIAYNTGARLEEILKRVSEGEKRALEELYYETKAAIYGHDANWGRILCALGYSGVQFDPEKIELYFESKAGRIAIFKF